MSEAARSIHQHGPGEPAAHELPGSPIAASAAVRAVYEHLSARLGRPVLTSCASAAPRVDVLLVPPSEEHDAITLYTVGMSAQPMALPAGVTQPARVELMLRLPASWPVHDEAELRERAHGWPLHWLHALAQAPARLGTWFGAGHTIPNGEPPRPFAPDTEQCCFVLVPPTCLDDGQDVVASADGPVQLLAAMPIYASELRVALEQGFSRLIEHLVAADVDDVLALTRKPAC